MKTKLFFSLLLVIVVAAAITVPAYAYGRGAYKPVLGCAVKYSAPYGVKVGVTWVGGIYAPETCRGGYCLAINAYGKSLGYYVHFGTKAWRDVKR